MSASARGTQSTAAEAKVHARFPKDAATLRRAHHALHTFAEDLHGELEQAVRHARSRQLGAARHVEQIFRVLLRRQRRNPSADPVALDETPTGFTISADLSAALKYVGLPALQAHVDAWAAAITALAAYEGQRFDRKPLSIGGRRNGRQQVENDEPNPEDKVLSSLEREASLLLGPFREVAVQFERRLGAGQGKRKDTTRRPAGKLTTTQVAKRLRVAAEKVRTWIANDELPATNVASAGATRSRWRIDEKDLEEFEKRRRPIKPRSKPTRGRRNKRAEEKDYF